MEPARPSSTSGERPQETTQTRRASVASPRPSPGVEAQFHQAYGELHEIARRLLRQERGDHTLQATALVHEVWLHLCSGGPPAWTSRAQMLAVVATAMRHILINHAVARRARKRGDGAARVVLDDVVDRAFERGVDLVALDEALTRLERIDPLQSRLVELRFFGHLTESEAARALGVSERKLRREWTAAKAWLRARLGAPAH